MEPQGLSNPRPFPPGSQAPSPWTGVRRPAFWPGDVREGCPFPSWDSEGPVEDPSSVRVAGPQGTDLGPVAHGPPTPQDHSVLTGLITAGAGEHVTAGGRFRADDYGGRDSREVQN